MESRLDAFLRSIKVAQENSSAFDNLCKFKTDQLLNYRRQFLSSLVISFVSIYQPHSVNSLSGQSIVCSLSLLLLFFHCWVGRSFLCSVSLVADQQMLTLLIVCCSEVTWIWWSDCSSMSKPLGMWSAGGKVTSRRRTSRRTEASDRSSSEPRLDWPDSGGSIRKGQSGENNESVPIIKPKDA